LFELCQATRRKSRQVKTKIPSPLKSSYNFGLREATDTNRVDHCGGLGCDEQQCRYFSCGCGGFPAYPFPGTVGVQVRCYVGLHHPVNADFGFNHLLIFSVMESITKKGVSSTQAKGQEQYSCFVWGVRSFRRTTYFQYDYRHTNGELFSIVAKSWEECLS
jgi:hypothetical protein